VAQLAKVLLKLGADLAGRLTATFAQAARRGLVLRQPAEVPAAIDLARGQAGNGARLEMTRFVHIPRDELL
jgi:hypothetical protein